MPVVFFTLRHSFDSVAPASLTSFLAEAEAHTARYDYVAESMINQSSKSGQEVLMQCWLPRRYAQESELGTWMNSATGGQSWTNKLRRMTLPLTLPSLGTAAKAEAVGTQQGRLPFWRRALRRALWLTCWHMHGLPGAALAMARYVAHVSHTFTAVVLPCYEPVLYN